MVKDGQYYYAPHRRLWGIWQHHDDGSGYGHGDFVKDCVTKEEARKEVRKEERTSFATKLLQDGSLSVERIANIADLPLEQVRRIAEQLKVE